jgi:hypothetical protein
MFTTAPHRNLPSSHMNPVRIFPPRKIHFNIILLNKPMCPKWSLSLGCLNKILNQSPIMNSMHTTGPNLAVLLDLTLVINSDEEYKL